MVSCPYSTSLLDTVSVNITPEGPASVEPTTVCKVFTKTCKENPDKAALKVERNGEWECWTWKRYFDETMMAAKSFIKLGVKQGTSVGILGFNSPEWFIADLGTIFAGGAACGIYSTNLSAACEHILVDANAAVCVVEDDMQLKKILEIKDNCPNLKAIVQWSGEVSQDMKAKGVHSWADFLKLGADVEDATLNEAVEQQKPGQCCTLLYTSGTTGPAKGVMISHDNLVWTAKTAVDCLAICKKDQIISYLPLSHVAAQMIDIHSNYTAATTIWFARPDALKGSLLATLQTVRPTIFFGVPRVWEKFSEKLSNILGAKKGTGAKIIDWARSKSTAQFKNAEEGKGKPSMWWLANALVYKKVRKNMGLERCRNFASGAAPLCPEVRTFFKSINIRILEFYGMSECTGPQTMQLPGDYHAGSPSMPGTEIKIANPDEEGNGEICFRGRHIFMGYLNNKEKTEESIDEEGWLHSGDIGKLEKANGHEYLFITGRLKELIITAGGENIPPILIENAIKEELHVLSNCFLIGDKRKFLSVLLTLKTDIDQDGNPTDKLNPTALNCLKSAGIEATTVKEAIEHPEFKKHIQSGIDRANEKATSRAQKVQKWEMLTEDFSIAGGELTPTMKVKRPIVLKKYSEVVEQFYPVTA
eukprot:Nk52_evm21s2192 gene=Nk52_evmTU21s2192